MEIILHKYHALEYQNNKDKFTNLFPHATYWTSLAIHTAYLDYLCYSLIIYLDLGVEEELSGG